MLLPVIRIISSFSPHYLPVRCYFSVPRLHSSLPVIAAPTNQQYNSAENQQREWRERSKFILDKRRFNMDRARYSIEQRKWELEIKKFEIAKKNLMLNLARIIFNILAIFLSVFALWYTYYTNKLNREDQIRQEEKGTF